MGTNGPTWSTRIQRHAMAANAARMAQERADYLICHAWNVDLDQGVATIQPSPTIGQAINGGFSYLRVICSACNQHALLDLRDVKRPATTPVWQLEDSLACTACNVGAGSARAPRAVIDRLTAGQVKAGWTSPPEPPEV